MRSAPKQLSPILQRLLCHKAKRSSGISPASLFASERDLREDHIGEGSDFTYIRDSKNNVIEASAHIIVSHNTVVTKSKPKYHYDNDLAKQVNCKKHCMDDEDPLSGQQMLGCFESGNQRVTVRFKSCL